MSTDRPAAERPAPVTRLRPERTSSFDEHYREQLAPLVRTATLIVGSRAIAEELVQDAFVRVHGRWGSIDHPVAYTRRAVVNACRSHLRRRVLEDRYRRAGRPEVADLGARELLDALAALPPRQRAALVLRYYDDLSERETAEVLGCAPGTVSSLVHRGLATLRTRIDR